MIYSSHASFMLNHQLDDSTSAIVAPTCALCGDPAIADPAGLWLCGKCLRAFFVGKRVGMLFQAAGAV